MGKVYVLFWFDVEDYITPQSDDALKKLAEIFDEQGERATFKFVGEKARVLEARGRTDVLKKMAAHEIGYHTDNHSQHPTVSEYLEELGWDEGAAEFERRERQGMNDLERLFGKRIYCYGQPGGAWAPQAYQAIQKWGVPVYLDEARHVGLNEQPFWYCGALNVLNMRSNCTRVSLEPNDNALPEAKASFDQIYERLKIGGGTASIYYHPCEFVATRFWDGVNFNKGQNTPKEKWRIPDLKPQDESEREYKVFSDYLAYIKSLPDVEIITASQLMEIYPDRAFDREYTPDQIADLARAMREEITYQIMDGVALSPAEIFFLIVSSLAAYSEGEEALDSISLYSPFGPVERALESANGAAASADFLRACAMVRDVVGKTGHLPSSVHIGNEKIAPANFLATASDILVKIADSKEIPGEVELREGNFTLEKYVTGEGVWGWTIFPENFNAPGLIDLGKLQTWTLKPAILLRK